ncbi:MAG: NAD(P)H-dependent oxidoreductase [Chitinispirillaceae bacterium]|nr:NAD(P)H-dependent oxidoreductase [Chitinispirillaceae bacterium]
MKMLLITAFPRNNGFTRYCNDLFIRGVKQTGITFTMIDIVLANINPCRGCFHCWCSTPGRCIQHDGMERILDAFLDCDLLACATPLYAYGVSSYLKIFLERTMPLLTPGVTSTATSGVDRNKIRFPDRGPRSMAALITGGLGARSHADGAVTSLRCYAKGMNMTFAGALVRNESYLLQFTDTKPKTIKTIETAFEQAGRMFALEGTIDRELIEKVATPLAFDHARFELYSNIYWEHAQKVFSRGGSVDEIKSLTRGDIRILMQEMVHGIDPVTTAKVKAVIQLIFPDTASAYCISMEKGTARLEMVEKESFDLKITCPEAVWVGIIHRTTDPLKALTKGCIRLEGDKELFRKFGRFFPPPNI